MNTKLFSSLNLLLENQEGSELLLQYYSDFSKQLFSARDFQAILTLFYRELRRIYFNQTIEIILCKEGRPLSRHYYDEQQKQVLPGQPFNVENTLYHHLLAKKQPVVTNNYPAFCANLRVEAAGIPAQAWMGIPLHVRGKILGALVLWDGNPEHQLKLADKQFVSSLANMVSFALENIYLYEHIASERQESAGSEAFGMNKPASIKSVIKHLLRLTVSEHRAAYTGLFLRGKYQPNWRLVEAAQSEHPQADLTEKMQSKLKQIDPTALDPSDLIFVDRNQPLNDRLHGLSDLLRGTPFSSLMIMPFRIEGGYGGVWLAVFPDSSRNITRQQRSTLRLFFFLMTQLLDKRAILERSRRFQTYVKHLERMKVVGELASGAAHHLNNLLSIVIGKGQILQRKLSDTPYRRDLDALLQAAKDGAESIRRLQNYSKGRSEVNSDLVNLNLLLQEVVEIARPRFEDQAQSRGIHYELKLNFSRIKAVQADPAELREVFLNLLNNALDAMPRGGELSIQTTLKSGQVLVFIADSGIGIPFDIQQKIFDPFYTTKGKLGNGLGLSIAKEIIEKYRGSIHVDSAPQKGSIFMVELPASQAECLEPEPATDFLQPLPHRVLLVEADSRIRETLSEMLIEEGCRVETASNADQALQKFQKAPFDVVFTDLSMPKENGIELARQLKAVHPDIPVFIMTGWYQLDYTLLENNGLVEGVIHKPFEIEKIREQLAKVVPARGTHQNGVAIKF